MLGFPILYFKGRRLRMFQLSGFYCKQVEACHPAALGQERPSDRGVANLCGRVFAGFRV